MNFKIAANYLMLLTANLCVLPGLSASLRSLDKESHTDCTLLIKVTTNVDGTKDQDLECETEEGLIYPFESTPNSLQDLFQNGSIESNFDKLRVVGNGNVQIHNGKLAITSGATTSVIKGNKEDIEERKRRRLQAGTPKNTLALWIRAADVSTTTPMDNGSSGCLTDEIFGTYGDLNNLRTQYLECSYGKANFQPFDGTTSTGANVSNGVYDVTISETVIGVENSIIRNAAANAATVALGSLTSQFDHVMFCIPPGTSGGWIAYAYVNSWRSVYNDQWCNFVSAQMHEMGHNLGLAHSGETGAYDDQSGMMGYSYGNDEGPEMCFNAAKNWQLGWYSDKSHQLNSGDYNWSGKIYGIDDYGSLVNNDGYIIIRLASSTTDDIYVSFNKKQGINSGTAEGGDQVLVHSRSGSTINEYKASVLLAKLNAGGTYVASIDGGNVPITVISLTTGSAGVAQVQIGSPQSDNPTMTPTQVPTGAPTKIPVTSTPTATPTMAPTQFPTGAPTKIPVTSTPTATPTTTPTTTPTMAPTQFPTGAPTKIPVTSTPTSTPTKAPTVDPGCSSISRRKQCRENSSCVWKRKVGCQNRV